LDGAVYDAILGEIEYCVAHGYRVHPKTALMLENFKKKENH
jgi:hypothetical protein